MKAFYWFFSVFIVITLGLLLGACGGSSSTPAPPANSVTVNTDGDWAAYQVGPTGPWTVVDPVTLATGIFTFDVDQTGKYGVALHDPSSDEIDIFQFTRNEILQLSQYFQTNQFTVSGNVTGMGGGSTAGIYAASSSLLGVNGIYTLPSVAEGVRDVFCVVFVGPTPQVFKAQRALNVTQNQTGIDFDFSSGGFLLSPQSVTITGGEANFGFVSNNNSLINQGSTTAGSGTYYSAAASDAVPGDHYLFMGEDGGTPPTKMFIRSVDATQTPVPFSFNFANIGSLTGVTATTATYPQYSGLSYTPIGPDPQLAFMIKQDQGTIHWEAVMSTGWIETATTYQLPDFSTLTNFPAASGFQPSVPIDWTVQAIMANKTPQELFDAEDIMFVKGIAMDIAVMNGTIPNP